jgi:pSer/pThr/pTyr-binding forkhead associated (FHA) protein
MVYRAEAVEPEPEPVPEPEPEPEPQEIVTLSVDGRTIPLADRAVIGRSRECDVRVDDANVSRRHAEIRKDGDDYWVADLGSTNGTELNGRRVERSRLADGDRISVGSSDLRFERKRP